MSFSTLKVSFGTPKVPRQSRLLVLVHFGFIFLDFLSRVLHLDVFLIRILKIKLFSG